MAISLKDISKNKMGIATDLKKSDFHKEFAKEKTLRPWESFDTAQIKTRTLRAQEAVRKAQAIVQRNPLNTLVIPQFVKSQALDIAAEENEIIRPREHFNIPIEKYNNPEKPTLTRILRNLWKTIVNGKSA